MGLMQKAVETYDANLNLVGIYREGYNEPLAPVSHTLTRADIEITIDSDGNFVSVRKPDKSEPKIIIPVTQGSATRTSISGIKKPHPLCDQLKYLTAEENYYIPQLQQWAASEHTHPFLNAILSYLAKGTLQKDIENGVGKAEDKDLISWVVIGVANETPECWRNTGLFKAYTSFYLEHISGANRDLCMIAGEITEITALHPKGIIPISGNAKIISANDSVNFTYRGRFTEPSQAVTIGYAASQKAHNALRWLASEQGVRPAGNRVFICWNPQGRVIPKPANSLRASSSQPIRKPTEYRDALKNTIFGFKGGSTLKGNECAVLTAFEAPSDGRLSVTYYNEISLETFFDRMEQWDAHCCWYDGPFGIQAPDLIKLVNCAFGTQRDNCIKTDDRILRQHLQRLLDCKISGGVFPPDIIKALVQRASTPLAYDENNWRRIVHCACAAIQKYKYDTNQGGNEMSWELDKKDRSFQFGRLLAVMERAEEDYYTKAQEKRQTNAIKYMSEFRRRPWNTFERINRQLHIAYLNRIEPWKAARYERLKDEICAIISEFPENEINAQLGDAYLMGYELQRNAFFTKSEKTTDEE